MRLFNNEKYNVLKMTQENLNTMQENNLILQSFLDKMNTSIENSSPEEISDEKKISVAYALNLCTVSISQIVDYNDIGFLEYEYEVILNNLNLENMPKDEELLKILKQLLDVITFFKIQDQEKKLLEKEYQNKLKNAIWSAVPNINMIVSGNKKAMALSIATQIGIGYMNYRRAKAELILENENKAWSLQRSAIEQFNGLKRELFDTAWRLADKYGFKDEFRLTERQISQFNQVLLDSDPLRKCERLEYIIDKFQAYPPFFYYLANAANDVFRDDTYEIETRIKYKSIAIENYNYFLGLTKYNILREDQLEAASALELFELLENQTEYLDLLERAIKASGNAFDVVQFCAISYLKLGFIEQAKSFLRFLLNENYNCEVNAQLLSKLYVFEYIQDKEKGLIEYNEIKRRCPDISLFPLPKVNEINTENELEQKFIGEQKKYLGTRIADLLIEYISENERKYNSILRKDDDISEDVVLLLNNMLEKTSVFGKYESSVFKDMLSKVIMHLKSDNSLPEMLTFSNRGATRTPVISYKALVEQPFSALVKCIRTKISEIKTQAEVSRMEDVIYNFKEFDKLTYQKSDISDEMLLTKSLNFGLIDEDEYKQEKIMLQILKQEKYQKTQLIKENAKKIDYYIKGEYAFDTYMQRHSEINVDRKILAIINDKEIKDTDLIITTKGIQILKPNLTHKKKKAGHFSEFAGIRTGERDEGIILNDKPYKDDRIEWSVLLNIISDLAKVSNQDVNGNWYRQFKNMITYN